VEYVGTSLSIEKEIPYTGLNKDGPWMLGYIQTTQR